ncbi:hypothetical protein ONQ87_24860, partial [Salmonella enterica subsp. enterica serovar Virginia]|nr:hypothetical protein [Salmonella enterica subsp. enterica serovar Virginia]
KIVARASTANASDIAAENSAWHQWSLDAILQRFADCCRSLSRFSARDLLLLSAVCGVVRWGLMGWSTALPWLIVIQILHCGTFT